MAEQGEDYVYLPLMTVAEAAKYLGVGKRIIYQLIEYDIIRVIKRHSTVLVEKKSLDAYRESGKMI